MFSFIKVKICTFVFQTNLLLAPRNDSIRAVRCVTITAWLTLKIWRIYENGLHSAYLSNFILVSCCFFRISNNIISLLEYLMYEMKNANIRGYNLILRVFNYIYRHTMFRLS